jgi:phage-related protein
MTISTFSPPRAPSPGSKKTPEFKKKSFGDGDDYVQEAPDGINPIVWVWDLTWDMLSVSDAQAIEDFMKTVGTWTPFYYTVPNDIQRKYKIKSFVRASSDSGVAETVTMTIRETHNP